MKINRYYDEKPIKKEELTEYTVTSQNVINAISRAELRINTEENAEI